MYYKQRYGMCVCVCVCAVRDICMSDSQVAVVLAGPHLYVHTE